MLSKLPGHRQHQALLRAVVIPYAHDLRVGAVCVFGSLGHGSETPCAIRRPVRSRDAG